MKVIFFGTSEYALPVLESLKKNFDLRLVVTRRDKPVGRKKILTPAATKVWAKKNGIPVLTPETLKKGTEYRTILEAEVGKIAPDLALVADYGLIIPRGIFELPRRGTLNIHFSKLPDLRGPSPVQHALLRGDTETWITVFKIDEHMDTGPILWQKSYPIGPNDTTESLYRRLFSEVAKELPTILELEKFTPQDDTKTTYTKFLKKDDGFVEWKKLQDTTCLPARQGYKIYNQFRAMTPWPGLWTLRPIRLAQGKQAQGKPLRMIVRKCHLDSQKLILDEVQFEGEKVKRT